MKSQTQAQIQMNFTQHAPSCDLPSELFEDLNWLAPLVTTFTSLQVLGPDSGHERAKLRSSKTIY